MAFDVNAFKQNIAKYGTLQDNKFEVSIPFNPTLQGITTLGLSDMSNLLSFRAMKSQLPGLELATTDQVRYGIGPVQKIPHNVIFSDASITFLADSGGQIYNFFYGWLNYIYQFSGQTTTSGLITSTNIPTYSLAYKDNYCTEVTIGAFDNHGNIVTTHTLHKAFPTAIQAIPLDWEGSNKLMKIDVQLSYFTYTLILPNTTSK